MKNKLISAKNRSMSFVHNHRTALTVAATATPLIYVQVKTISNINAFLKENDLYETYYTPEEI